MTSGPDVVASEPDVEGGILRAVPAPELELEPQLVAVAYIVDTHGLEPG